MLRAARAGDEPAIEAFLEDRAETSMFLRGNLARFGLFDRVHPHATAYSLAGDEGDITAVFGISNAGFVMSQAPGASRDVWRAYANSIRGRRLAGITGDAPQVAAAKRALKVDGERFALEDPEPLYRLTLADMVIPDGAGVLRAPGDSDRAMLQDWTRAYSAELHMSPPERLDEEGRDRADRALASGDARLLEIDGTPVAMTAINARLPDMVQIGGVYTPPALRGRGHARRAVALHMAEELAAGVATAILFASGPAACRAYEAIGFDRIGTYALAILTEPVVIGGTQ